MMDPTVETQRVASRAAACAQILDIRMLESSFKFLGWPGDGSLSYGLQMSPEVDYELGDDAILLTVTYDLKIESIFEDDSTKPVAESSFNLGVLAGIRLRDGEISLSTEEVEAWSATTGSFALYPYAREYIQGITARMGLPALTLSVMRFDFDGPAKNELPTQLEAAQPEE